VYLVFVLGAAGSVVVLAVVFFLSVWVGSGLVGYGLDVVMLVVGASRVRHLHVAFARHFRLALVSGYGYFEGSRAYQGSRRRIPIVVVRVKVSGYGAGRGNGWFVCRWGQVVLVPPERPFLLV
jgi:hypothetical protein